MKAEERVKQALVGNRLVDASAIYRDEALQAIALLRRVYDGVEDEGCVRMKLQDEIRAFLEGGDEG